MSHFDYRTMKPHERTGVGKGTTDREAAAAAIGEALERYCAGQPDHRRVRRFAWKQRSGDAITPPECVLYSERQYARPGFPYRRWREDMEVPWIAARELPGEGEVWAPTSLIYLDYLGNDADVYFCPPTSNGLAAGVDLRAAILRALRADRARRVPRHLAEQVAGAGDPHCRIDQHRCGVCRALPALRHRDASVLARHRHAGL